MRSPGRHGIRSRATRHLALLSALGVPAAILAGPLPANAVEDHSHRALLVGTWHHHRGQFASIQSAVNAARPGDWILVAPGDYHTAGTSAVLITTPGIHVRGMDRNRVIVDGTLPDDTPCDPSPARQDFGPPSVFGFAGGRNGIEVLKVDGVTVENLTVCNFLSSRFGDNGNGIWFNGGDGTGVQTLGRFAGSYLSATSTYFKDAFSAMAQWGIFAANVGGPGLIDHTYASNMGGASYYIGACPDCNVVLSHAHAQNSVLGYFGVNAGGHLVIQDSEWDHNEVGISPSSLNSTDPPPPQNGACPSGGSGRTGTHSCTVIRNNYVHDNNNPNVPAFLTNGAIPVGTGIEISGGQNDSVTNNRVERQGAWGILVHDFPDTFPADPLANCQGGIQQPTLCYFPAHGNEVASNILGSNGFFGNQTNGDLADATMPFDPGNCWHGNVRSAGRGNVSSYPPDLQATNSICGIRNSGDGLAGLLGEELACASDASACIPSLPGVYPRQTKVEILALDPQPTMPDPCEEVPSNPWCPE